MEGKHKINGEYIPVTQKLTTIDVWYNKSIKLWVAQLKDQDGNQIGESVYDTKTGVKWQVEQWKKEYNL